MMSANEQAAVESGQQRVFKNLIRPRGWEESDGEVRTELAGTGRAACSLGIGA
jgi:hypothetical protein